MTMEDGWLAYLNRPSHVTSFPKKGNRVWDRVSPIVHLYPCSHDIVQMALGAGNDKLEIFGETARLGLGRRGYSTTTTAVRPVDYGSLAGEAGLMHSAIVICSAYVLHN